MKGSVPCGVCGAPVPVDHSRCSRCGTTLKHGAPNDLHTVPGQPLVRAPKRRRISSHDLVPAPLRAEYQAASEQRARNQGRISRNLESKKTWVTLIGAALAALPFAAAAFFYMPDRKLALLLMVLDALMGGLAGRILLRAGGGAIRAVALYAPNFAAIMFAKIYCGYPVAHNPAAFAVLAAAGLLAISVSGFLGVALDESDLG